MFPGLFGNKILYLNDRHEESDTGHEDRKKLYDKRILPLLDKDDLAIFGERTDPVLLAYYNNLGLANINIDNIFYLSNYLQYPSLTKTTINNPKLIELIKDRRPDVLMPYIASKDTIALAQKINCRLVTDFKEVERINNKAKYRNIIQELSFPLIPGFRVNNLEDIEGYFKRIRKQGFTEVVLKKERSVAGFGVFIVRTRQELKERIKKSFSEQKSFLIEGFIKGVKFSSNVQYWIGVDGIKFITMSDQLFGKDRVTHNGNVFPSLLREMPNLWRKIEKLSLSFCNYLQTNKCYGLVGIDYLLTKDNRIYSTEANYRLNCSTFPALIVEKLFRSTKNVFWETFTIKGYPILFEELLCHARKLFIHKKESLGIFPIDVGILKTDGEAQFMAIASDRKHVAYFKSKIMAIYENISCGKM